jgi:hypothetical protein
LYYDVETARTERLTFCWKESHLRELTADLFISLDGFASGVKEAAFFGYFGEGLGKWVSDHLHHLNSSSWGD